MVEVNILAQKILDLLHKRTDARGHLGVSLTELYKAFEDEATYEVVQQSIRYLADRDLIAPFSYSLTAKGRRTMGLERAPKSKPGE